MKKLSNKSHIIKFFIYLLFITLMNFNNIVFADNGNRYNDNIEIQQKYSELLKSNTYKDYNDNLLDQAKHLLNNFYYYDIPESVDKVKSVKEIIEKLEDPYTQYYTEEEFKKLQKDINNMISGVGVHYKKHKEGIEITDIIPGSSAEYSGVKLGDIVIKIDRKEIKELSLKTIDKYLNGEEGTKAILDVKRGSKIVTFILERRTVQIPTVNSNVLDQNIGYVNIKSFGNNTPKLFKQSIEQLLKSNIKSLIVDLRGNKKHWPAQ